MSDPYSDHLDQFVSEQEQAKQDTPTGTNPYDAHLDKFVGEQEQLAQLRASAFAATSKWVTKATDETLDIQSKTGLPHDAIANNLDTAQGRDEMLQRVFETAPLLSKWLTKPEHYSYAQDDIEGLTYFERQMKRIASEYKSGQRAMEFSELGVQSWLEHAGVGRLNDAQRARAAEINNQMQGSKYGIDNFFDEIPAYSIGQIPIQFQQIRGKLLGAAAGAVAGAGIALTLGQVPPLTVLPEEALTVPIASAAGAKLGWNAASIVPTTRMELGLAYLQYINTKDENGNPLDPDVAFGAAAAVGVINGALEMTGVESLLNKLPGVGMFRRNAMREALKRPLVRAAMLRYGKTLLQAAAVEGGTEFLQSIVTSAGQVLTAGKFSSAEEFLDQTFSTDNVQNAWQEAKAGAAGGIGIGGVYAAPGVAVDVANARAATKMEQHFLDIGKTTEAINNLKHAPLGDIAGGVDNLFIDIDAWDKYWQDKGIDPGKVAKEVLGDTKAYDDASASGAPLVIPTEKYAKGIAPTEHNAYFAKELRVDPEQMNAREADAFIKSMEKEAAPTAPVDDTIASEMADRLEAAGFNRQTAEDYAAQTQAFFQTQGERYGVNPVELFRRYGMTLSREDFGPNDALLGQAAVDRGTDLPPFEREIEQRFAKQLSHDFTAAVQAYDALPDSVGGKVISTDVARELSADYNNDRSLSRAVHEPASWFIKQLYAQRLQEIPQGSDVLFTAGGTGAGKTTALESTPLVRDAALVYDGNLSTYESSRKKIDQALAAGHRATIALIVRDPVEAFRNGVLKRARSQALKFGTGRAVPAAEHIRTHIGSLDVVKQLAKDYADNPNVDIQVVDNRGGPQGARVLPGGVAAINALDYNPSELVGAVNAQLEEAYRSGEIDQKTYTATGRLGEAVGRQLEQERAQERRRAEVLNQGPSLRTEQVDNAITKLQRKLGKKDLPRSLAADLYSGKPPTQKFKNQRAFGEFLEERAGGEIPEDDAHVERLSNLIAFEALHAARGDANAATWYRDRVAAAMRVAALLHPELETDAFASFTFSAALAITSNGTAISKNVELGNSAYEAFKATGKLPEDFAGGGKVQVSIRQGFALFNTLRAEMGDEKLMEFFNTEHKVGELNEIGKTHGFKISGESVLEKLYGSAVLGPKIGQGFFQNLRGNYKPLTIDRWFMRTWGRLRGKITPAITMATHEKRLNNFREALTDAEKESYGVDANSNEVDLLAAARLVFRKYARDGFTDRSALNRAAKNLVADEQVLVDAPSNGSQRKYIRKVVERATEKVRQAGLDVDNADLQALIWYPEKELYKAYGVANENAKPTDYATEFAAFAVSRGFNEAAVQARVLGPGRGGLSGGVQQTQAQAEVLNQTGYHGSPHEFDQFKLQHIGSGEGAQAYGWGLYFSSQKKIAQWYRDKLAGRPSTFISFPGEGLIARVQTNNTVAARSELIGELTHLAEKYFDSERIVAETAATELADYLPFVKSKEEAVTALEERVAGEEKYLAQVKSEGDKLAQTNSEYALAQKKLALALTKQLQIRVEKGGKLYTAEIPEQADMLDWDKPLSEQSPKVKAALKNLWVTRGYMGSRAFDGIEAAKSAVEKMGLGDGEYRLKETGSGMFQVQVSVGTVIDSIEFIEFKGVTGQELYAKLTNEYSSQEWASKELLAAGIPGLTYTGRTSSERNFVVFDDGLVKIQKMEQDKRGYIAISPERKLHVGLFSGADLSTFIHESGHAYLEVFMDLVRELQGRNESELTVEQKSMLGDASILLDWFGIKSWDQLTVDHKEQFARGFEAYTMEGRAPSIALRKPFARFRAWMLAIYRTVKSLNVTLNNDVREVFDRMLASDDAIEAAQREAQLTPVFTDATSAQMSETEFKNYRATIELANLRAREQIEQKLIREWQRERAGWWKTRMSEVAADVDRELSTQKAWIAERVLRTGTLPDGSPLVLKIDSDALREQFPDVPREALRGMLKKGGNDPTMVANALGYGSADALIQALLKLPNRRAFVMAEARKRMLAQYGDMLNDGTLAEQAKEAVANDWQQTVVMAELKALNKLRAKVQPFVHAAGVAQRAEARRGAAIVRGIPPLSVFQRIAAGQIAQQRVRDLRPGTYLAGARKASQAAVQAVLKGDYAGAAVQKQRELVNLELYRESTKVRGEIEGIVKFARSLEKPTTQKRLGTSGYLDQVRTVLDQYSFRKTPVRVVRTQESLTAWVEDQLAQGVPVDAELVARATATRPQPYQELSVEQLRGVNDLLRHLDHLSRLKNRLLKAVDKRSFNEAVDALTASIVSHSKGVRPMKLDSNLPQERALKSVGQFFAAHRKVSSLARQMDGDTEGPVWEYLVRSLNAAADRETTMRADAAEKLNALFAPYATFKQRVGARATRMTFGGFESGLYKHELVPEVNLSMTKAERLAVALNWGNDGNRQRLKSGYDWTDAQVEAILKPLTKADWDFVQGVWDHIDSYWPEIAALSQRVDGVAPEKVEATTVSTAYGDYRGGYYPIRYTDSIVDQNAKALAEQALRGATVRATTKHGHREARAMKVQDQRIRLDIGVVSEHVNNVIHDLTHFEALIDANRLLRDKRVHQAMRDHYGQNAYDQFRTALDDVAAADRGAQTAIDRGLNWIRQGMSISTMGWSVMTSAIQFTGITQSIVRIGPKWVGRGISRWLRSSESMGGTIDWVNSKSEFMRARSRTQMREIAEVRNTIEGGSGWAKSYFSLIAMTQRVVDMPTWLGAYEKAMADVNNDEARAVAIADQAVRDAQGSGLTLDLARVMRGGPVLKIWTTFGTFFNTTYNLTAEAFGRTRGVKDVPGLAIDLLMLYVIPAALGMMLRDALRGAPDGEDDEDWWRRLAREELGYVANTVVLGRELSSPLTGFDYTGPAGTRFFAEAGNLATQVKQGEMDEAFWKALNRTLGIGLHYPALQVQRTAEGMIDLMNDDTNNPLAVVTGPPPKQ